MQKYMGPALFGITVEAMKNTEDDIALQGVEFWTTVCDLEMDIAVEVAEAEDTGRPIARESRHFARGKLCRVLLEINILIQYPCAAELDLSFE